MIERGKVGLSAAGTRLVLSQQHINIFKKEENSQFNTNILKFVTIVQFIYKNVLNFLNLKIFVRGSFQTQKNEAREAEG